MVNFDFESDELTESDKLRLEELVGMLAKTEYEQLHIVGYTDAPGSKKFNQKLSEKRARTVSKYLIDQGIPDDRLLVSGMGEENLIEDHEEKSAVNRRAELILKNAVLPEE